MQEFRDIEAMYVFMCSQLCLNATIVISLTHLNALFKYCIYPTKYKVCLEWVSS